MKNSTMTILKELAMQCPDQTVFKRREIEGLARGMGFTGKDFAALISSEYKIGHGTFDLTRVITPNDLNMVSKTVVDIRPKMQTVVNEERNYAQVDPTFVPWGSYADIVKILKTEMFYPVFISGLSGNGKTFMVEQACAKLKREFVRVQVNPETDEDDLLGGFRLVNGETVFAKGPVLKAMENGAVLLLDEIDRGTNKIMCLQGILEGKPVVIKKTGEIISPAPGFTVISTANTKGKGSEDGRFVAASIIDEAFLERFTISIDQKFPSASIENKILLKHAEKFGVQDAEFVEKLVSWADIIRKTFYDEGVDEVISTRRLCHIIQSYSIFEDRMKSIDLCISRFDDDTKLAFLDLYSKVDANVQFNQSEEKLKPIRNIYYVE